MLVKICGITNVEDAKNAVSFGADALGFVFAKSPRIVEPKKAKKAVKAVKGRAMCIGVFVDEKPARVNDIVKYCGLDAVQLHGGETPGYCSKIKADKVIKAFRIKDRASLKLIEGYDHVFAYLLDTFSEHGYGGTGRTFDWSIAVKAKAMGKPVILSGGLNIDNINEAVKVVRPYGVDISSSVEAYPGKKDPELVKLLLDKLKTLD